MTKQTSLRWTPFLQFACSCCHGRLWSHYNHNTTSSRRGTSSSRGRLWAADGLDWFVSVSEASFKSPPPDELWCCSIKTRKQHKPTTYKQDFLDSRLRCSKCRSCAAHYSSLQAKHFTAEMSPMLQFKQILQLFPAHMNPPFKTPAEGSWTSVGMWRHTDITK